MKRAHSTTEELSDLEDHDFDNPDSSDDSARVEVQPLLPKSKVAKRESNYIEHVSHDVIAAAGHVIELLNSPGNAATGYHMLAAWAEDPTASAILCRLPVLGQLHSFAQHDDDRGEKARRVLACMASRHPSLAATLLQTLGPADFFATLRGIPTIDRVRILAEHLPAELIVSTLVARTPSEPMLTMVCSMLVGLDQAIDLMQPLASEVYNSIYTHMVSHKVSVVELQHHLVSQNLSSAHVAVVVLAGLLELDEPSLPDLQQLVLPLSQLLFYSPIRPLCLQVLLKLAASVPQRSYNRTAMLRVIGVIESNAHDSNDDEPQTIAAQILLHVLRNPSGVVYPMLELINGRVLMQVLAKQLRPYYDAFTAKPLLNLLLQITTLLLRSSSSLKYSLLRWIPVAGLASILRFPPASADVADCIHEYIHHADDVAQRLCQHDQVRAWFALFVDKFEEDMRLADLAATVLHAGADAGRELKSFLADPAALQKLGSLLKYPLQRWHSHVIWMLRFASSGSERRKNTVFQSACSGGTLAQLALELNPRSAPEVQRELSAFFKSLTSLAGPRKTAIFGSLNLTDVSRLLRSPDENIQEHVAGLLRNLTHGDNNRKQAAYQAMDLQDVLHLLTSTSVRVLQSVTGLLQNLCTRDEARRDAIFGQLPLATVIDLLRNPDLRVHAPTAGLLMNLCRSSLQRKRAVLEALPLCLVTNFYENGPPPPALADQAAGLTQHMRMAFLSVSREQLHQMVRGET
jgi:hypothetical protein